MHDSTILDMLGDSPRYKQSRGFAQSQLLLGAQLLCLDLPAGKFIALRYPVGPLRKIVCVQSPKLGSHELQQVIKRLSARDVIIEIPVQFTTAEGQLEHDFIVELKGTVDEAYAQLEKRSQRALRQAKEHGLAVRTFTRETITADALDGFYRVYADRMRRFGSPAMPREYIEFLLAQGKCVVQNVYHEGKVIAGATLVLHHGEVINELIASSEEALQLRPNNLLVWHFLLYGLEHKAEQVNLGPSPLGSAVALFKESMGGRPVPQYAVFERYPRLLKLARRLRR